MRMAQQQKNKFHHGNLQIALLESARALLDKEGEEGVTIRAVARRTGVSHAAPANHFPDRKSLLTALAALFFSELHDSIKSALKGVTDPEERVCVFVNSCVIYGLTYPKRYRFLWRQDLFEESDSALSNTMDCLYDAFVAAIAALRPGKDKDIDTLTIGLWSMFHGYISMRLNGVFQPHTDMETNLPRHEAMVRSYLQSLHSR